VTDAKIPSPRLPRRLSWLLAAGVVSAVACGSSGDDEPQPSLQTTGGGAGDAGGAVGGSGGTAETGGEGGTAGALPDAAAGMGGAAGGSIDAAVDAEPDASVEACPTTAPSPPVCGDGYRDPLTEECDDGNGSVPADSCSSECRVTDLLPVFGPMPEAGTIPATMRRKLGKGRHPIAAGASGSAVAFVDYLSTPPDINLKLLDPVGAPLPGILTIGAGLNQLSDADPVVAALPGGKYAAAWTDVNADGSDRGVAFRIVDPAAPPSGPPGHANAATAQNQEAPDIVWTGSEIVVAWQDASTASGTNFFDIRARRFSVAGTPLGTEDVAVTSVRESLPALAGFGSGWAAAWRTASGVNEAIGARAGSAVWSVGPFANGPAGERPALVELDATRLLVVFSETTFAGSQSVPRVRGALLDTQAPGLVERFAIEPLVSEYSALPQYEPNVVRVGDRIYVAWRGAGLSTWSSGDVWLKEVSWSGATSTLDLSEVEIPLTREPANRAGAQYRPALAASPLCPQGALVTAWDDHGRVFGAIQGTPDFVVSFIPTPILRLPDPDAGTGQ
jgi:cysteine-rich repeat protein